MSYGSRISNLSKAGSRFKFDCEYGTVQVNEYSADVSGNNVSEIKWHPQNPLKVETGHQLTLAEMASQKYRETTQELEKQKETLWMKYAVNAGGGILGAMCPPAGLVFGIAQGISEGSATKTGDKTFSLLEKSGMFNQTFLGEYQAGGKAATNAVGNVLDYIHELNRIEAELTEVDRNHKLEWFGASSSFTAGALTGRVNSGYYNAGALLDLKRWEEHGLRSMVGETVDDGKKISAMITDLQTKLEAEGNYGEEVRILLDGNGSIFGMDVSKSDEAVEVIEKAYENIGEGNKICGKSLDIQYMFQNR